MTPDLEQLVSLQNERLAVLERKSDSQARRLQAQNIALCLLAATTIGLGLLTPAGAQIGVTLASLNTRLTAAEGKITAVENKTADMSVLYQPGIDDPDIRANIRTVRFSGVNVQIVNGLGSTGSVNGVGNLVVGYNEFRAGADNDDRNGSHNIVVGTEHNFTASAYGGLIAGYRNTLAGLHASVVGGSFNTASGPYASVLGGQSNQATSLCASVAGGRSNYATGEYASVSGGVTGIASGNYSTNGGGSDRNVTAAYGWTAGRAGGAAGTSYNGNFNSP